MAPVEKLLGQNYGEIESANEVSLQVFQE